MSFDFTGEENSDSWLKVMCVIRHSTPERHPSWDFVTEALLHCAVRFDGVTLMCAYIGGTLKLAQKGTLCIWMRHGRPFFSTLEVGVGEVERICNLLRKSHRF